MIIRLHTDETLLPSGIPHVALLAPFFGRTDPVQSPEHDRFDRWIVAGPSVFALDSLSRADFAVLPFGWEATFTHRSLADVARRFADRARAAGKALLVFCESDRSAAVPIDNAIVFRTSLFRATRGANEHAMPGFTGDLLSHHFAGRLATRPWSAPPVVGFRGHVPEQSRTRKRDVLEGVQRVLGTVNREPATLAARRRHSTARFRAVRALETSTNVTPHVVREPAFAGGSVRADGSVDYARLADSRRAYAEHISACQYTLCVRGAGNYSYRFYETLCLGRIPLFIDSDCVLPFEERTDVRRACVSVALDDVDHLGDRLRAAHDAMSPDEFVERQRNARSLWETWLSPEGFFTALGAHADALR